MDTPTIRRSVWSRPIVSDNHPEKIRPEAFPTAPTAIAMLASDIHDIELLPAEGDQLG